jgi:hypothetical protein
MYIRYFNILPPPSSPFAPPTGFPTQTVPILHSSFFKILYTIILITLKS